MGKQGCKVAEGNKADGEGNKSPEQVATPELRAELSVSRIH